MLVDLIFSFRNIGIQCVKKKEVKASLLVRAENKVDPFSRKSRPLDFAFWPSSTRDG